MKKISTVRVRGNMNFRGHKLTIGLDLGDRWSFYCVRDKSGKIILEQKLPTTPEAMKQTFAKGKVFHHLALDAPRPERR